MQLTDVYIDKPGLCLLAEQEPSPELNFGGVSAVNLSEDVPNLFRYVYCQTARDTLHQHRSHALVHALKIEQFKKAFRA